MDPDKVKLYLKERFSKDGLTGFPSWVEQIYRETGPYDLKSIPGCCIATLEWAETGGFQNMVEKINENMYVTPVSYITFKHFIKWIEERKTGKYTGYGEIFNELVDKASEGDFK